MSRCVKHERVKLGSDLCPLCVIHDQDAKVAELQAEVERLMEVEKTKPKTPVPSKERERTIRETKDFKQILYEKVKERKRKAKS